jgi:hypothetical protein
VYWAGGRLHLFSSNGTPVLTTFGEEARSEPVTIDSQAHFPMWIESVWQGNDGALYAWYHYERTGVCPGVDLHSPEIGALVSTDGGKSFTDLGIVLASGASNDCTAQNGYFAGGHGDFSVIPDRTGTYLYFLFDNYGGEVDGQGVAMARIAVEAVRSPVGAVWKYHAGSWSEPGLGGAVTPIFPATTGWQAADTDSFWGPSIHWNTSLQKYVVLMNRACCEPGWPQAGIYLTTNPDLDNPAAWTRPGKILDTADWYPWVLGSGLGETSAEAGSTARLFVGSGSAWEIVFRPPGDVGEPGAPSVATGQ